MNKERLLAIIALIAIAALARLLPHPYNFTPIGALALFSGAQLGRRWLAFIVPCAALFISDMMIGFYPQMYVTYLAFVAVVCIGTLVHGRAQRVLPVAAGCVSGSVLFFLITNYADWLPYTLYPKTWEGVMQGYIAAVPFFQNTLAGDAFYATLLFGGLAFIEYCVPRLRAA